jgi:hypothetical protein
LGAQMAIIMDDK